MSAKFEFDHYDAHITFSSAGELRDALLASYPAASFFGGPFAGERTGRDDYRTHPAWDWLAGFLKQRTDWIPSIGIALQHAARDGGELARKALEAFLHHPVAEALVEWTAPIAAQWPGPLTKLVVPKERKPIAATPAELEKALRGNPDWSFLVLELLLNEWMRPVVPEICERFLELESERGHVLDWFNQRHDLWRYVDILERLNSDDDRVHGALLLARKEAEKGPVLHLAPIFGPQAVNLLDAVAKSPDDDGPRLVWADTLTEQGDPRGELVVAQCALAKLDEDDPERAALEARAEQLVALHPEWGGDFKARFARGFIDSVEVPWYLFKEKANAIFAIEPPVREIRIADDDATPTQPLDDPRLARVRALDVSGMRLRLWARLPADLRSLRARFAHLADPDLERIVACKRLNHLDLGGNSLRGRAAAIAELEDLRSLKVDTGALEDADVQALRAIPDLDLGFNHIGSDAIEGLRATRLVLARTSVDDRGIRGLTSLTSLDVVSTRVTEVGIEAVLRNPKLRRLRLSSLAPDVVGLFSNSPGIWEIELCDCALDSAIPILEALPGLRALRLGRNRLSDAGLAELVAHPAFGQLDVLDLDRNRLGPEAGAILARAPRLPLRLTLYGNDLGDEGAIALASSPAVARIAELDLRDNRIDNAGARAFAASPHVANVGSLNLDYNQINSGVIPENHPLFPRISLQENYVRDRHYFA